MNFINRVIDARPWGRESRATCDIEEKERRYELRIEVPRANESDIMVAVMNGGRTLAVEVDNYKGEEVTKSDKLVKEFLLDERVVHIRKILAVLDNGVLKISVPRKTKEDLTSVHMIPIHSPESMRQHFSRQKKDSSNDTQMAKEKMKDSSKDNIVSKEQKTYPTTKTNSSSTSRRKIVADVDSKNSTTSTRRVESTPSVSSPPNTGNKPRIVSSKTNKGPVSQMKPKETKILSQSSNTPLSKVSESSSITNNPLSAAGEISSKSKGLSQEEKGLASTEVDGSRTTTKSSATASDAQALSTSEKRDHMEQRSAEETAIAESIQPKSVNQAKKADSLRETQRSGVSGGKPEAIVDTDLKRKISATTEGGTEAMTESKSEKIDAALESRVDVTDEHPIVLVENEDAVDVGKSTDIIVREGACATKEEYSRQQVTEMEVSNVIQKGNECNEEATISTTCEKGNVPITGEAESQLSSEPTLASTSFVE